MKKIILSILALLISIISYTQTILFTEDFESGTGNWTLNNTTLPGGTFNTNAWVVNSNYQITAANAGFPPFFPPTPAIDIPAQLAPISPLNMNFLHINAVGLSPLVSTGPIYFAGGGDKPFATMSSDISTVGYTGVAFSFNWLSSGGTDQVYYSIDAGVNWIQANATNYNTGISGGSPWALETITDIAFDGQATLRFGFLFDDTPLPQVDPPFCIDDVMITGIPTVVSCNISNIASGIQTACVSPANTYTQDVILTYANAPAGNVMVNNQSFAVTTSTQTVTLAGLTADGNAVDVQAIFDNQGLVDDFENGTTMNWSGPTMNWSGPTTSNIAMNGPFGINDNYLTSTSSGMGGPGGKMVIYNATQWIGDFTANNMTEIKFWAKNPSMTAMTLRVALTGTGGNICTTTGYPLPAMSDWTEFTIPIEMADMSLVAAAGPFSIGTNIASTLSNVSQMRILSNTSASFKGQQISATLEIDMIRSNTCEAYGVSIFTAPMSCLVAGPTTWTGAVDTDWSNTGNWTSGVPSMCSQDAIIPMGLLTYPIISTGTVGANNLTLGAGATLTVAMGADLQICGDISSAGNLSGLGTLTLNGTTDQNMTGVSTIGTLVVDKTVAANNTFTINLGSALNVTDHIDLIEGSLEALGNLVLVSTAIKTAYIDDFSPFNNGDVILASNVMVQRYIANPGTGFHFISSPVNGFDLSGYGLPATAPDGTQVTVNASCDGLMTGSAYGQLFDYRENSVTSTCLMEGWHVRTTGSPTDGQGFAAIINNGSLLYAVGDPNTGTITTSGITYNAGLGDGWNLVGNPYPSALDWGQTSIDPLNAHIVGGTAHLYASSGFYDGSYLPANAIISGDIASGQGFFVQVTSATDIIFENGHRTTADPGFKSQEENYKSLLTFVVSGPQGADKTHIAFGENFTNNSNDFSFDAIKKESKEGNPTLYTENWNTKQAINALPLLENSIKVIPMGLKHGTDGNFNISIEGLETFGKRALVFIEDKETGIYIDMRENNSYTFNMTNVSNQERFNIHFVPENEIVIKNESCAGNDASIEMESSNFIINGNPIIWDIELTHLLAGEEVIVSNNSLVAGTYKLSTSYNDYLVEDIFVINAADKTTADFKVSDTDVFIGELIQFTNHSKGNATYEWNFGDGNFLENSSNPTYSYNEEGEYEIELTSSTNDCVDNKSIKINVVNKTTDIIDVEDTEVLIYSFNKEIIVDFSKLTEKGIKEVKVYNLLGQNIINSTTSVNEKIVFDLNKQNIGYYLVSINKDSSSQTYKVLIK